MKVKQNEYKNLGQFKFWCQKVLPLVYDDSLSYYELLCKVVNYLNDTISNMDLVGEDMTKLYNAYSELEDYVNNYFNSLDVQEEINKKLDSMADDGTLSRLIMGIIRVSPLFVNSVDEMTNSEYVYVLNTSGHIYTYKNGEWVDTGIVYGSASNAIYGIATIAPNNGYTDCDDFPINTVIAFVTPSETDIANLPEYGNTGQVITYTYSNVENSGIRTQIYTNTFGASYFRTVNKSISGSKSATQWVYMNGTFDLKLLTDTNTLNDLNNFPNRSIIAMASSNIDFDEMLNLPTVMYNGRNIIQVITMCYDVAPNHGIRLQLCHDNLNTLYYRTGIIGSQGPVYSYWKNMDSIEYGSLVKSDNVIYSDVNELPNRSIVAFSMNGLTSADIENLPSVAFSGNVIAQIITMGYSNTDLNGIRLQIYHDNRGKYYYRTGVISSSGTYTFTDWVTTNTPSYFNCDNIVLNDWSNKRVCVMGDSLTAGVTGVSTKWYNVVSNYLDTLTITSVARGGAGYVNDKTSSGVVVPTFGEQFDSINVDNFDAFILMGGVNDSTYFVSREYSYDMINNAIINLFTKLNNTGKPVLIILPPQAKETRPILTEICKLVYDNIYLIDKGDIVNMNWFNNSVYYLDAVHLNDNGQFMLGKSVASFLK